MRREAPSSEADPGTEGGLVVYVGGIDCPMANITNIAVGRKNVGSVGVRVGVAYSNTLICTLSYNVANKSRGGGAVDCYKNVARGNCVGSLGDDAVNAYGPGLTAAI